jgi:two-component system sensor histidine kinase KdpD
MFIEPYFTWQIRRTEDLMMIMMFFIIALLNGVLTSKIRFQEKKTRIREQRTDALYQITKELSATSGMENVTEVAQRYIKKYFNLDSLIWFKNTAGQLILNTSGNSQLILSENENSIVSWVSKQSSKAGKHTSTLPSSDYTFYPLLTNTGNNIGVIAIKQEKNFTQGEEQFWETFISQISGKYEREFLRDAARKTYLLNESDKLYKTLFNSISHELRIPIATILGASDTLLSQEYSDNIRNQLYTEINTASIRLNHLIENLLNMSRLESGRISAHLDWCDVNDLANQITQSLVEELSKFNFKVVVPQDMPLVKIDYGLIEQVISNLVLNSTQHADSGSTIRLKFFYDNGLLNIQVMDRGSGFAESDLSSIFDKFYRGMEAKAGGIGLGLSIVKGFVEAHQGTVVAQNRKNGGALITVKIPVEISEINLQ